MKLKRIRSKQGYTSVEFTIVIFMFMLILMTLMFRFFDLVPTEANKISEQSACSRAELMADAFFNSQGNSTNWEFGGAFYTFGLSTGNISEINYSKWQEAESRGYINITNSSHLNQSFSITYWAYSFSTSTDANPEPKPDSLFPRVHINRSGGTFWVVGGSNSTIAEFDMKLTLPLDTSPTIANCTGVDGLEPGDKTDDVQVKSKLGINSTDITFDWTFSDGDVDCLNITTTDSTIYIKSLELDNTTFGRSYPIYLGNHTELKQDFGARGLVDASKTYCEVNRKGLLRNELGERVPINLELTAIK